MSVYVPSDERKNLTFAALFRIPPQPDLVLVPHGTGEIVTTGTLTRVFPVASGEIWTTELTGVALAGPASFELQRPEHFWLRPLC